MSAKRVAALVAAAGEGHRLGLGPKAFVEIGGATLLAAAVAAFDGHVDELVVAVPPGSLQRAERFAPDARLIEGAPSRQATVRRLLAASEAAVVLVHDVARPYLTADVIARVIAAVERHGACTAAIPLADTIVDVADGRVVERERLRAIQTPQAFERSVLERAHARAEADGVVATDDAALVRRLGHPVVLVDGSPLLAKLTSPADLDVMEALLPLWRRRMAGA